MARPTGHRNVPINEDRADRRGVFRPAGAWKRTAAPGRSMMPHRIREFETFTVELPIAAPLRHSYAVHSAFKRTLLCLTTENGLCGWGETAAPERLLQEFRSVVVGEDPF